MKTSGGTRVIVVTGLAGGGKTTAIAALEDRGYHAIENLPPTIVERAIEACEAAGISEIALGLTSSVAAFVEGAANVVKALRNGNARDVRLLFLEASDEALTRRFSETRRPHPIEAEAHRARAPQLSSLLEGIVVERERLASLRALADVVIDTSALNVHDLKRRVLSVVLAEPSAMSTRLVSFGFKSGIPSDVDLVFDVRFLSNPFFVPNLKNLTGLDPPVSDYVLGAEGFDAFIAHTVPLLEFLLPRYQAEGKSYLTVAIGCTGGQHRSVATAVELHRRLARTWGSPLHVSHRDIAKKARLSGEFEFVIGSGGPKKS